MRDGGRAYDPDAARCAAKYIEQYANEHGGQVKAGQALGIAQGTVSRIITGELQATMPVLLRLRDLTGKSLDVLLGLVPDEAPSPPRMRDSEVTRLAEAIAEKVVEKMPSEPPPPEGEPTSPRKRAARRPRKP